MGASGSIAMSRARWRPTRHRSAPPVLNAPTAKTKADGVQLVNHVAFAGILSRSHQTSPNDAAIDFSTHGHCIWMLNRSIQRFPGRTSLFGSPTALHESDNLPAAPSCDNGTGDVQLSRNTVSGLPYFSRTFISADPASGSSRAKVTKVEVRFLILISTSRDWTFTVKTSPAL
jgi:hypothetical protein